MGLLVFVKADELTLEPSICEPRGLSVMVNEDSGLRKRSLKSSSWDVLVYHNVCWILMNWRCRCCGSDYGELRPN